MIWSHSSNFNDPKKVWREYNTLHFCERGLNAENPLQSLEEWDDFVASRYRQGKDESEFRNYAPDANLGVAEFYRQNHAHQTLDFVLNKKKEFLALNKEEKSIWEAAEFLNTLVSEYQTLYRIYDPHCGLDKVHLSWGHDEDIYHVVKDHVPEPALSMLRTSTEPIGT
jgi:hypothetical protein